MASAFMAEFLAAFRARTGEDPREALAEKPAADAQAAAVYDDSYCDNLAGQFGVDKKLVHAVHVMMQIMFCRAPRYIDIFEAEMKQLVERKQGLVGPEVCLVNCVFSRYVAILLHMQRAAMCFLIAFFSRYIVEYRKQQAHFMEMYQALSSGLKHLVEMFNVPLGPIRCYKAFRTGLFDFFVQSRQGLFHRRKQGIAYPTRPSDYQALFDAAFANNGNSYSLQNVRQAICSPFLINCGPDGSVANGFGLEQFYRLRSWVFDNAYHADLQDEEFGYVFFAQVLDHFVFSFCAAYLFCTGSRVFCFCTRSNTVIRVKRMFLHLI